MSLYDIVPGLQTIVELQSRDSWLIESAWAAFLLLIVPSRQSEMFLWVFAWSVVTVAAMIGLYWFCYTFVSGVF